MKRLVIKKPEVIKDRILKYFQSSEDLKLAYRLHCILMLIEDESLSCDDVAKMHGTTPQTIARWIHTFNKAGDADVEILKDKQKPGRNTRIKPHELNIISDVLKKTPSQLGLDAEKWNGLALSELLKQKFNIDLKVRQCQRIMQKLGYANKRGRQC